MHILFLSRWFPFPPSNGSKIRVNNLLRGLSRQHSVTLISFVEEEETVNREAALEVCQSVHVVRRKPFTPQSWRAWLGFFSSTPRSVIDTFSSEMARQIEDSLATQSIDLVIASQVDMAVYSKYFGNTPAIFEEVEVGVLYGQLADASGITRVRNGLTWLKHRHYLRKLFQNFAACTVVSNQERDLLGRLVGGIKNIEVLPNCLDLAEYELAKLKIKPDTLIFIGAFSYNPNYEAMVWFVENVLPLIQSERPDVHLTITGNHQNRPLPAARNLTRTGFIEDIRPLVAQSWVSIVPLHTGGGTRLKILESMALGTPVIATTKGAEGLDGRPGQDFLVADTPEAFAQNVVQLLNDEKLRQQLAENGSQLIREKYDWQAILPQFLDLIERVANK